MAEAFAIVPLAQGVMARLVFGEDAHQANVLIAAGVVLTAGSYFLGKLLSKRKLSSIREQNAVIEEANLAAKTHNDEVDLAIRDQYSGEIRQWRSETQDDGRVETFDPDERPTDPSRDQ